MKDVFGAPSLMEIINVLCDESHWSVIFLFKLCQGEVGGVGGHSRELGPSLIVEVENEAGISLEGFRRGDIFDPVTLPEPIGIPESAQP